MNTETNTITEMLTKQGFFKSNDIQVALENDEHRTDWEATIDTELAMCDNGIQVVSNTGRFSIESALGELRSSDETGWLESETDYANHVSKKLTKEEGAWKVSDFITFDLFTKESSRKRKWNRCTELSSKFGTQYKLVVSFNEAIADAHGSVSSLMDDGLVYEYGTNGEAPEEVISDFTENVWGILHIISRSEQAWCAFQQSAMAGFNEKHSTWFAETRKSNNIAKEQRDEVLSKFDAVMDMGFQPMEGKDDLSFSSNELNRHYTFRTITQMGVMELKVDVVGRVNSDGDVVGSWFKDGKGIQIEASLKVYTDKDLHESALQGDNLYSCWYGIELMKENKGGTLDDAIALAKCIK